MSLLNMDFCRKCLTFFFSAEDTEKQPPGFSTSAALYSLVEDIKPGIDLSVLVNAPEPSEFSSATNINEKVRNWVDSDTQPDSGFTDREKDQIQRKPKSQVVRLNFTSYSILSNPFIDFVSIKHTYRALT